MKTLTGYSNALTVAMCCLVTVFEGFDLQAAGVAAPRLTPAFHLTPHDLGWFFSASTFGLMVGSSIGGRLSDRFGRKIAIVVSVAIFGLMSIVTGLSEDVRELLVTRFLTGVGLGGALPNLIAMVAENTPVGRRSGAIGLLYAGMLCGGAIASLVSVIGAVPTDWRGIFFVGGVAPLAILPLVAKILPGSMAPAQLRLTAKYRSKIGWVSAVFDERRASGTALLWLASFLALLIMYLLLNWLPSLLISRGLTRGDASFVQTAFNIFGAAGSVATGWLLNQRRWRGFVAFGVFGAAAMTLAAVTVAPAALTAWLLVGAALGATVSGCQATLYGLAPSCYPTAVRGTGVGMAVSVGRFGSAAGPLLAAQMLAAGLSSTQVLLALMPVVAVAGIAAAVLSIRPAIDA